MPSIASMSALTSADEAEHQRSRTRATAWARAARQRADSSAVLLPLHEPVDAEGQHRRHQQQEADHRAALEVLLADDELEDVGREHVEVAADHLRDAEVGHARA